MIQYSPKRLESDVTLADVMMAIDAGSQRRFRVIRVNHIDIRESDRSFDMLQRRVESLRGANIVPRCENVRGINANAHRQIAAQVRNRAQLLESRSNRAALPRRVLQQNTQPIKFQSARRLPQSVSNRCNGVGHCCAATCARVRHQKIRTQRQSPHQLAMKCLDRAGPERALRRCQINQIIVVNYQRAEPQLQPSRAKSRGVCRFYARAVVFAGPHARAGRKNLHRICAQSMRDFECSGDIAGNGSVDSDASAAIHPARRARRRSGFRAVFVLVFVGGCYVLWFFGHSLRISRKKINGECRELMQHEVV